MRGSARKGRRFSGFPPSCSSPYPSCRAGGDSLVRLDAASRTLLFFGARVRIEEFYLFLIALLILVFGFLFVTMVFGRVWCGWLCPQTTIADLADCFDRNIDSFLAGRFLPARGEAALLSLPLLYHSGKSCLVLYPPRGVFPSVSWGRDRHGGGNHPCNRISFALS